ncbi:hypothetical protein TNCV_1882521 [Trichonephila clavipes]|nr:hypothetical protein TNCV_1882521 [Trichonephila clavipes]
MFIPYVVKEGSLFYEHADDSDDDALAQLSGKHRIVDGLLHYRLLSTALPADCSTLYLTTDDYHNAEHLL